MGKEINTRAATIAALLSNFIFGLSFMASRIALEHTTSSVMLTLRFGASALIMLLLVLAVIAGSGFTLCSRSMADEFTAYERTFVMMVMGFVFFAASGIVLEGGEFAPLLLKAVADKYVILPVLYLSLASSVIAFILLNYSVTYLDAAKATVFTNLIPVISLLAGVMILGEPFSVVYLIGIILILVGVYKVNTAANAG